ncbi:DUF5360 family protein [Nonomuraea sp. NPDC046570]|uniref:DUF5360 family protein n=1 Tax=Nonomuraea sp. NPDC046570 TaxID=3155255 RepID=UPI0033D3C62D
MGVRGLRQPADGSLRGDFTLAWWIPNLYLLLFPVPAVGRLIGGHKVDWSTSTARGSFLWSGHWCSTSAKR